LRVVAPGEQRLNFFFPEDDIRSDLFPTRLHEVSNIDFYIDSSTSHRLYAYQGIFYNQIIASRTRTNAMRRTYTIDDGRFRFAAYRFTDNARFVKPDPNGKFGYQVGDFAYFWGHDLSTLRTEQGEALYLTLWWEALRAADKDYSVFIHLWHIERGELVHAGGGEPNLGAFNVWEGVPGAHFDVAYHTRLWEAGEIIKDEWKYRVPLDAPPGRYELRAGLFDAQTGARLPMRKDGRSVGDYVVLNIVEIVRRP
jgi:hypothetical protein